MADEARRSRWLQPPAWTTREAEDMAETVTCGSLAGTVDAEGEPCEGAIVIEISWGERQCYWALTGGLLGGGEQVVAGTDRRERVAHCWRCGARLSFDAAGNPVAEAMVPADEADKLRRALEWIAIRNACAGMCWPPNKDRTKAGCDTCGVLPGATRMSDCTLAAAIAAAEEGAENDGKAE